MTDLNLWLAEQGWAAGESTAQLGVPLETAQDRVYRGALPSPANGVSELGRTIDERRISWLIQTGDSPG